MSSGKCRKGNKEVPKKDNGENYWWSESRNRMAIIQGTVDTKKQQGTF